MSQFFIWFAAGMNFPSWCWVSAPASLGLSLMGAVTAILVGSLVGAVVMGILSRMGGRLGVAQQIQARGPLGFFGNFVPVAYINIFAGIGWAAVTVILGAQAAHALAPAIPYWLAALVLVSVQLVVAIYGYNMIHYLQRILAVVLFFGFLVITVVSVARGYQGAFGSRPGGRLLGRRRRRLGDVRGVLPVVPHRLVAVRLGLLALPARPGTGSTGPPACGRPSGNFVSLSWLGIAGAILGGSATSGESPIEALHRLTGPFAIPALLTVLLSSFSQNFLNVYGGAISIQTLRIPVSRRTAVIFICATAFLISLWADEDFESKFKTFLFLGAYLIAPFGAVLLLDYVLETATTRADRRAVRDQPDLGVGVRRLARRCGRVDAVLAAVLLHRARSPSRIPSGATSPTSSDSSSRASGVRAATTGSRRCGTARACRPDLALPSEAGASGDHPPGSVRRAAFQDAPRGPRRCTRSPPADRRRPRRRNSRTNPGVPKASPGTIATSASSSTAAASVEALLIARSADLLAEQAADRGVHVERALRHRALHAGDRREQPDDGAPPTVERGPHLVDGVERPGQRGDRRALGHVGHVRRQVEYRPTRGPAAPRPASGPRHMVRDGSRQGYRADLVRADHMLLTRATGPSPTSQSSHVDGLAVDESTLTARACRSDPPQRDRLGARSSPRGGPGHRRRDRCPHQLARHRRDRPTVPSPPGPFAVRLDQVVWIVAIVAVAVGVAFFGVGLWPASTLPQASLLAVGVTVATSSRRAAAHGRAQPT